MELKDLPGYDLGTENVGYDSGAAMLYALAVGARCEQLDLVYERDLRVLPTYACALGLWAVERAGELGAYDRKRSLHASQSLTMHQAMPREGPIPMRARVAAVWDKVKASIVEIEVSSAAFTATYTIFLPNVGSWGGSSGPRPAEDVAATSDAPWTSTYHTSPNLAALYRLTGDRHPVHIDPDVARANGFERPILHGLCTLGIAAREIAAAVGVHPAGLSHISARLSGPVLPGDTVAISARRQGGELAFEAAVGDRVVLKSGRATFITQA